MKEVTRIVTAQITEIAVLPDEAVDELLSTEDERTKLIKRSFMKACHADDVLVDVKNFVRDLDEEPGGEQDAAD